MAMLEAGHAPDLDFEREYEVMQQLHRQQALQQQLDDANAGL